MKKLFTTIMLVGATLCTWASYTVTPEHPTQGQEVTTITVHYVDDGNSNINDDFLKPHQKNATTLVLTGDWANKDLENAGKIVKLLSPENGQGSERRVYLDLSACTKMFSKVKYTGEGDPDWTSSDFVFLPNANYPETVTVTGKGKAVYKYYEPWGVEYTGGQTLEQHDDGLWYEPGTNYNGKTRKEAKVDENGKELPENATITNIINDTFDYSYTYQVDPTPFSLANEKFYNATTKLSGVSFPNHENFTAVPDNVFGNAGPVDLASATVGDNVVWIGEHAFKNTKLTTFDFPKNLKVIAPEAFDNDEEYRDITLTEANLGECTSLVKIGYEAFEGCMQMTSVTFPSGPSGNALTFIGNDAFQKSGITSVDMSMCEGITEFQAKNDNQTVFKTFANCTSLTSVSLPPNLREIPDDSGNGVFFGCTALQSVTFNGSAEFGTDENGKLKLLNPFIIGKNAFKEILTLNSITFADDSNLTEIREDAFNKCINLPAVNLTGKGRYVDCELINPLIIKENAFFKCTSLADLTLSNNVQSIAFQAFHSAAITEIHIPASVEYLAKHSFYGCQQLANVYFDKFNVEGSNCTGAETFIAGDDEAQGKGAFEECQHITDVYVLTDALLHCQNNAFDQDITWGAGDVEGNFATLHYPKDNIDNYVNRKHYLTDAIVGDPGLFHRWLHEHYDLAGVPNKNGWYEFINVGPFDPQNEEECQKIILRTFSDYKYNYLVPNGLRAYVVSDIHPLDGDYEVTLTRIRVIPKQTGVILYGHPNGKTSTGEPTLVLTPVEFAEAGEIIQLDGGLTVTAGENEGLPLCRKNWGNNYVKNYLEPILSEDGTAVEIKPYEKENGVVTFRNFALGRYTSTDYNEETPLDKDENNYVGFFRMKPQSYKSGYAYLRLSPNDGFDVADGGEIFVKPDTEKDLQKGVLSYSCEYKLTDGKAFDAADEVGGDNNPKGWWNRSASPVGFYWDEYSMSWGDHTRFPHGGAAKYFGEFEENADGIVKLVIPNENAKREYYTLQGVKVTNPTKGVYILNGKKVIVK